MHFHRDTLDFNFAPHHRTRAIARDLDPRGWYVLAQCVGIDASARHRSGELDEVG